METPNLFNYATSELSQDAFILWLLDWANPQYKEADKNLHVAAQAFVRALLDKQSDCTISKVECIKQKDHIDVLAIINDEIALIIEDKTNTKEHGRQIRSYANAVAKKYPKINIHCVYFKTGNESYASINSMVSFYKNKLPYPLKIVMRQDVISLLSSYAKEIYNPIYVGYLDHIREIEKRTSSYQILPADKWPDEAWEGFFMEIEKEINKEMKTGEECNWGKDYYHKDFMLPRVSIGEGIHLYLYLDKYRNLSIKANCEKKCSPAKGWKYVVQTLKDEIKIDGFKLYTKEIQTAKDAKLIEIKRFDTKRKMFIAKTLPYSAQPNIVPQLIVLHKRLVQAALKIK